MPDVSRARGEPPRLGFDVLTREQIEAVLHVDPNVARHVYVGFPDPAVVFRAGPVWNADTFALWHSVTQLRTATDPSRPTT
jgi:hypothetical protein